MKKTLVIVTGTGRCGTKSLSALLNAQKNTFVPHEAQPRIPWEYERSDIQRKYNQFKTFADDYDFFGDVGMYYLPFIWNRMQESKDIVDTYRESSALFPGSADEWTEKIIILTRSKQATVDSYVKKIGDRNHFVSEPLNPDPNWDPHFPTLHDGNAPLRECVEEYYDLFTNMAVSVNKRPNVWLLPTVMLNNCIVMTKVLKWIGYKDPFYAKTHLNKGEKDD